MGGTLEISRTGENTGTTLVLTLPLQVGSSEAADEWRNETATALTNAPDLHSVRVLVIDDAADNRLLISRMLAKTGASVEFASNGPEGLNQCLTTKYDVILMDLQMPEMDGFEVTKLIRNRGIQTPIVALTAHAIDEIRDRCEKLGFSGFLTKPLDLKRLLNVVDAFSSGHESTGQTVYQGH